jgi:hypothetical protein
MPRTSARRAPAPIRDMLLKEGVPGELIAAATISSPAVGERG